MIRSLIAHRERPLTGQGTEEVASRTVTDLLQDLAIGHLIECRDGRVARNDTLGSVSLGRGCDNLDRIDAVTSEIVVPVRFPQPAGAGLVVVEVVDSAVRAILGTLRTVLVSIAFRVAVVVGEVGERDVGGIASPDAVDDAG